ncbi:MAG: hypothetical protein ACTSWM_00130 [Alphaproteobacteria bacterium]
MRLAFIGFTALMALAAPALGQGAQIVDATAVRQGDGIWRFDVTVRHDDSGWEDYADAWEVLGTDGTVLGKRVLLHPHVNEQPFTRSLTGVAIPAGVAEVVIRAHDNVDGYSGNEFVLELPQ